MAERTRGYAHRIDIVAPLELVWRGLVEPELLAKWCGPGARASAREGGYYTLRPNGERDLEREAHIDVFDPQRRLRLIYMPPTEVPDAGTVMVDDFILAAEPGSVALRLMGSGFAQDESWDEYYVRVRAAWGLALARLKVLCEQLASGKRTAAAPPSPPARPAG